MSCRRCITLGVGFLLVLCAQLGTFAAPAAPSKLKKNKPAATQMTTKPTSKSSGATVVGWLEISGRLRSGPAPYAWVDKSDMPPSLEDVLDQLHHVAKGDQYKGVVIYLDEPSLTRTQAMAIGEAMKKVRAAGKKVLCFSVAYDLRSYLLASYANLILLQHRGSVELSGMSMEQMYFAGLFKKIGVRADLLQIGKYKGAEEPFTREGPSKAWQENLGHLLDGMYSQIIGTIASNRHETAAAVEKMIHDSWGMNDHDYLKSGVVDRLVDRDLLGVTQVEFGNDFVWDDSMGVTESGGQMPSNPFAMLRMLFQTPQRATNGPTIAVLHAFGAITGGRSRRGAGPLGSNSIGSRTMVKVLGELRDDSNVKGVVIRLDSPGGSALASEVIWQAVRKLANEKPVFVSVGGMAASGAYYISSASDEIYVSPESIVGSIGVVGGKVVLGGLYDKLGIHVTHVSRGPWGDMFNSVTPFTDAQRKVVHASMVRVYQQFLDRVRTGRGKRLKKPLDSLAKGRLFTGTEAVADGLADKIGTQDQAVAAVAKEAGLKRGDYTVQNYPGPLSLQEYLQTAFGVEAPTLDVNSASALSAAASMLGPRAWSAVNEEMTGMMQLRNERVLMLMPAAIVVK